MLVLRRQAGESFRIGPEIEVRVLSISPGGVKIGVIAPREVDVYRTELDELNRKASKTWTPGGLRRLADKLHQR